MRRRLKGLSVIVVLMMAFVTFVPAQATTPSDIVVTETAGFTPNVVTSWQSYCPGYGCYDYFYVQSLDFVNTHNLTFRGAGGASVDILPAQKAYIYVDRSLLSVRSFYCKYYPSMEGTLVVAGL